MLLPPAGRRRDYCVYKQLCWGEQSELRAANNRANWRSAKGPLISGALCATIRFYFILFFTVSMVLTPVTFPAATSNDTDCDKERAIAAAHKTLEHPLTGTDNSFLLQFPGSLC
ncbi:hypothetical protein XELAEV_18023111mg [Xenopus laevis]|uniref:Uncharacterized protein n=1 Tax=Xenopus laevis TaxID=8355 RepID=A0A974HNZ6_XENLA|nr:hypothetical protein XELAEV_18023111mg [Xenopus laevis]